MEVVRFHETERYEPQKDWLRVSLCNRPEISIEHFTKPAHHASPEHSHPQAQVLVVISGKLEVRGGEDTRQTLGAGDAAYFAPQESHVVTNLLDEPSMGIDIFVPGRSFDFWLRRTRETVGR